MRGSISRPGIGRLIASALLAALLPACGSGGSGMGDSDSEQFKPKSFSLVSPSAGAMSVPFQPVFQWSDSPNAQTFQLQVARTGDFANPVIDASGLTSLTYTPPAPLGPSTTYYWRVIAYTGPTWTEATGSPRSFTTAAPELRRVAFQSDATTLVPGDTNGRMDMFVRDIQTGTTTRGSLGASGNQLLFDDAAQGAMTPDGKYLAFQYGGSDVIPGRSGISVYVRNLDDGTVEGYPEIPNRLTGGSPTISADGRLVAFTVFIVGGNSDIYVWDRQTGTVKNISVTPSSAESTSGYCFSPAFSGNGRFVAFYSSKTDLVDGDTNGWTDVFVRDLETNVTELVSLTSTGELGNSVSELPSISADGRIVAFVSYASNLVPGDTRHVENIFVRDRLTGTTEIVSISNAGALPDRGMGVEPQAPSVSADGRYVAFEHGAGNLVPDDNNGTFDIFVRDRAAGTTRRVSVSSAGVEGIGRSRAPSIFPGGRYVAFTSEVSTFVPGDTNGVTDIFLHDMTTSTTTRLSVSTAGVQADAASNVPIASGP